MELIKHDLTKKGEPRYTTFFYHLNLNEVHEVVCNGTRCALHNQEVLGLNKLYKWSSSIPKYILKKLNK